MTESVPFRLARRTLLAAAIIALISPSLVSADDTKAPFTFPKAYTAEMEASAGGTTTKMKMMTDGASIRMETAIPGMPDPMVTIMRPDKKLTYMIMTAQKSYMETPLSDAAAAAVTGTVPDGKWELIGSETIDGIACDKYKCTAMVDTTGDGKKTEMVSTFYVDKAKKLPVRTTMEMPTAATMDWKSITPGAPAASNFELPAGFTKMGG